MRIEITMQHAALANCMGLENDAPSLECKSDFCIYLIIFFFIFFFFFFFPCLCAFDLYFSVFIYGF